MILNIEDISIGYTEKVIQSHLSFSINSGEILCLLGPNGVGKTTLFRSLLGLLPIKQGEICLNGESIVHWSERKRARKIAYVPQAHLPPFSYTVQDVVIMGRNAHISRLSAPSAEDRTIATDVLQQIGIEHLAQRDYTQISGGERQMVMIARALAAQPDFLLMDEPSSSLDFGNQARLMNEVCRLGKKGMGIIMSTHAPDQAFMCATKVALLKKSGLEVGNPEEILNEQKLEEAYGIQVRVLSDYENGQNVKTCVPMIQH